MSRESVFEYQDVDELDTLTYSDRNSKQLSYDVRILPVLEDIRRAPKQRLMSVMLFCGHVGSGKTLLAIQILSELDPTFDLSRVVYTHEELIEVALKLKPGQAVLWDEARQGTASKRAMSHINQRIGLFLDTVRSRCLFIGMIQPDYFNFEQGIAVESSDCLFHVYKTINKDYDRMDDGSSLPFKRGFYDFYNRPAKNMLYWKGKKYHRYSVSKPSIRACRFGPKWPFSEDDYELKKNESVARMNEDADKEKIDKDVAKFNNRVNAMRLQYLKSFKTNWPSMTLDTFCQLSGETRRTMLLVMDADARRMFDIGPHAK